MANQKQLALSQKALVPKIDSAVELKTDRKTNKRLEELYEVMYMKYKDSHDELKILDVCKKVCGHQAFANYDREHLLQIAIKTMDSISVYY